MGYARLEGKSRYVNKLVQAVPSMRGFIQNQITQYDLPLTLNDFLLHIDENKD